MRTLCTNQVWMPSPMVWIGKAMISLTNSTEEAGAESWMDRLPPGRLRVVFNQAHRQLSANREALHLRRLGKRASPHYGSDSLRLVLFL